MVAFSYWGATVSSVTPHFLLEEVEIVHTKTLKDYCLDISKRLDSIGYLSVSPEKFSEFIFIVALCESGGEIKIKGRDSAGSYGLWQMSESTRNKLKVRQGNCLSSQSENYYKFLVAVGKTKIRSVKNSVDLHCFNFAPSRNKDGVLSKVTNPQLEALDFNKDGVITREDFKLFQKKEI